MYVETHKEHLLHINTNKTRPNKKESIWVKFKASCGKRLRGAWLVLNLQCESLCGFAMPPRPDRRRPKCALNVSWWMLCRSKRKKNHLAQKLYNKVDLCDANHTHTYQHKTNTDIGLGALCAKISCGPTKCSSILPYSLVFFSFHILTLCV